MEKPDINVDEVTDAYHSTQFDPNGSYTGVCEKEAHSTPVQDADDL